MQLCAKPVKHLLNKTSNQTHNNIITTTYDYFKLGVYVRHGGLIWPPFLLITTMTYCIKFILQ